MSKHFPECPLKIHNNCTDFYNPKICAIVRKDRACLRKHLKSRKAHTDFNEAVKRIKEGRPA
jgi:hypothetical protein